MALLVLICLTSHTFGAEIVRVGNSLILRDSTCSTVNSIAQSLAQWTRSSTPNHSCPRQIPAGAMNQGKCQLDISRCVPEHVLRYEGKRVAEGPNCWNLSLVMKGILPHLRLSTPEEMSFYMNPPLCRALRNGEAKLPGDIGAIRQFSEPDILEVHGFIHISENLSYSKNGTGAQFPYQVTSTENVFDAYNVPRRSECRQNQVQLSPSCEAQTSYYRCSSMESYLNQHPNIPQELTTALRNFGIFDRCLEAQYVNGSTISREAQNNLEDATRALTFYLEKSRAEDRTNLGMNSEERDFMLGSLQLRLSAIVENLPYDESTSDLRTLRAAFDRSLGELKETR